MKRVNEIAKMMLKIDKDITVGALARIINGQSIKIDLVV